MPYLPDWPGAFSGDIVHSADYRNPVGYAGRRVLVVGAGNETKQLARAVAASRSHEAVVSRAVSAQGSPAP